GAGDHLDQQAQVGIDAAGVLFLDQVTGQGNRAHGAPAGLGDPAIVRHLETGGRPPTLTPDSDPGVRVGGLTPVGGMVEGMPLLPLATALGLGLLIGAVTERGHPGPQTIAGLRTHALAALCGAVALWLHLAAFVPVLVLLGVFVAMSYRQSQHEDPGLTSEIALVLTCLLGGLAVGLPELAAGLGVVVAVLLYAKAPLHRITRDLVSEAELQDGLILLASALVILPLVPDRTLDPWGVFNPSLLWTLVVLVMAISTLG